MSRLYKSHLSVPKQSSSLLKCFYSEKGQKQCRLPRLPMWVPSGSPSQVRCPLPRPLLLQSGLGIPTHECEYPWNRIKTQSQQPGAEYLEHPPPLHLQYQYMILVRAWAGLNPCRPVGSQFGLLPAHSLSSWSPMTASWRPNICAALSLILRLEHMWNYYQKDASEIVW